MDFWQEAARANIPDCKEEGCECKVVTVSSTADYTYGRRPGTGFPGCHLVPPQQNEIETILLGWEVAETCSAGHEVSYYKPRLREAS